MFKKIKMQTFFIYAIKKMHNSLYNIAIKTKK